MIPRAELAPNGGQKEGEPQPKVRIVFIGINHHSFNLQVIDQIVGAIERFSLLPGKKIIFREWYGSTPSDAGKDVKLMEEGHYTQAIITTSLRQELKRAPAFWEVEQRRRAIEEGDIDTILSRGLLSKDHLCSYFLSKALEQKAGGVNFRYESHEPNALIKIGNFINVADNANRLSYRSWTKGEFDQALEHAKSDQQFSFSQTELRERDIVPDLKRLIKTLLKKPDGGVILLLFGATHGGMIDALQRQLGPNLAIAFEKIFTDTDPPDCLIEAAFRNRQPLPDLTYARQFLYLLTFAFVEVYAQKARKLDMLAHHFQDIDEIMVKLANSFSLEEIRRICEERQDIGELLRTHPLAQPLGQWFDF